MRSISFGIAGVLIGIAASLTAQSVGVAEVEQAHEQLNAVTRQQNTAAWANLVTDDLLVVPSDGRLINKAARIELIRKGEGIGANAERLDTLRKRPDYRVRVYGSVAIVTWVNPAASTPDNVKGTRTVRVFVTQGSNWRLAHSQQTPLQ